MLGPIVNALAIALGAVLGIVVGTRVPIRIRKATEIAIGIATIVIGMKMAMQYHNILNLIGCMSGGAIIGSFLELDRRLQSQAQRLASKMSRFGSSNSEGLAMASILFCTGSMSIIGSIQSGAENNHEVLFAKSVIDGVVTITLAATYGLSVLFAAIPVLIYEGSIALLASKLSFLSDPHAMADVVGTGGALLLMIGFQFVGMGKWKIGDFLPALALALFSAWILHG